MNPQRLPVVVSATIGTDPNITPEVREAYLKEQVQKHLEYVPKLAETLLYRLLLDGSKQGLTFNDIERLTSLEKLPDGRSPQFIRKIIVELMVALRPK